MINFINKGVNTTDATATADDILSDKSAYVNKEKISGAIQTIFGSQVTKSVTSSNIALSNFQWVGGDWYVRFNDRDVYIYKRNISTGAIELQNQKTLGNDSRWTRHVCTSYSKETNDIRIISTWFKYLQYTIYDCETNTFSVKNAEYQLPNQPLYNTISPYLYVPEVANNIVIVVMSDLQYNGGGKAIWTVKLTANGLSTINTIYANRTDIAKGPTNIYFCNNDKLLCVSLGLSSSTNDYTPMYFKINTDGTYSGSSSTGVIEHGLSKISSDARVAYNGTKIYKVTMSEDFPTIGNEITNPGITDIGDFSTGVIYGTDSENQNYKYLYSLNNNYQFTKIYTLGSFIKCTNAKGLIKLTDNYNGEVYEDTDLLTGLPIIQLIRRGNSYYETSEADAIGGNILNGKIAYGSTGKITGSMPNNGALSYTPSSSQQTIPAGYTSGGTISSINNQTKSVTITENGNTTIVPDSGYDGISEVAITTAVSGGGGSVILDVTDNDDISVSNTTLVVNDDFTTNYTEVEYIQSTGSQYIQTDFMPTSNTKVETKLAITQATSGQNYPKLYGTIGSSSTESGKSFFLEFFTENMQIKSGYNQNSDTNGYTIYTSTISYNTDYEIIQDKNTLYLNGTLQGTCNTATFSTGIPMPIFVVSIDGTPNNQYTCMKLYKFKIYDNDVLMRDLVPCYRNLDNVIGLYDKVTGTFYTNRGTGTFLKGADV